MKKRLVFGSLVAAAAMAAATQASAAVVCPPVGASASCGYLITVAPNGTVSGAATGIGPYDGSEDTLVGVINNSPGTLFSLTLSGSNIFGFEGDGLSFYTGTYYGPTGYEGPNTSFTILNANNGTVNFTNGGVAGNGGTAYFSLEENLSTVSGGVTVVRGGVPEPATWAMMLLGFGGIGVAVRRKQRTAGALTRLA